MMPEYSGYHTKTKRWSGTTTVIVVAIHLLFIGVLYRISQTEYVQSLIKVTKLTTVQEPVKPPDPPPPSEPAPKPDAPLELPPESPAPVTPPQSEPVPLQEELVASEPGPAPDEGAGDAKPVDQTPFAIGKGRGRFAGYEDVLTAAIQVVYRQPPDLPEGLNYAVLCQLVVDDDGYVLGYRLVNSSGSEAFDRSTQQALSRLRQVRPPPPGMSHTIIVKFFPP